MRPTLAWLPLLLLTAFATRAEPPAGFEVAVHVQSNALREAAGLAWAPDGSGRLFVVLKHGQVRVVRNGALLPTPFITESVDTWGERGLVSIAFDPDFVNNRYVYFFATVTPYEQQILRYTDVENVGVGRTVIVDGLPAGMPNHNGGGLAFGPDGLLYFGVGELGIGAGADDDLTSLASKVGRVHPDGAVPEDNPFFDGAGPNHDLIWARGFRNPFRLTFQPGTGRLWVNVAGDVYEQSFVVGRGDHAGWREFENNQPAGFLPPAIAYPTATEIFSWLTETGAVRQGGVATFTAPGSFGSLGLRKGSKVTISEVRDPSFNGDFFVTGVPGPFTFTVAQPGPDAVSGDGMMRGLRMGFSIVGGAFYDATLFPPEYRGNYFFGDFAGLIHRATFAEDGSVATVDQWADIRFLDGNYHDSLTDLAVGPDGALYATDFVSGTVLRITPIPAGQGLVVSPDRPVVPEGDVSVVMVSLAMPPAATVTVEVTRTEGDPDLSVREGASLRFTPEDWSVPQFVTLAAAQDADADEDRATFTFSSRGLAPVRVEARSEEDEVQSLVVSSEEVTLDEGETGTFTVALALAPTAPVTVSVSRTSGDEDLSVTDGATLTFTPENGTSPQTITVGAARDADGVADTAVLTVSAPGMESRVVTVNARDVVEAPAIISTPVGEATSGEPYVYELAVTGRPVPTLHLEQGPRDMTLESASGLLSWMPEVEETVEVSVRASNGVAPDAVQVFQVHVRRPSVDAGTDADGGASADAGTDADGGASADAGTEADGGASADAGSAVDGGLDGGTGVDAGATADAGSGTDGGTGPGPGEDDSSGCGCGATALSGAWGWWLLAGLLWMPRRLRRR